MFLFILGVITGLFVSGVLIGIRTPWPWVTLSFLFFSGAGLLSGALCEAAARADGEMEALCERAKSFAESGDTGG